MPGRTQPCVLIVDDDDDLREVIAEHLTREGFIVAQAPTGADASTVVSAPAFTLRCDLCVSSGNWFVLTNDLSHAYIDENMGTS